MMHLKIYNAASDIPYLLLQAARLTNRAGCRLGMLLISAMAAEIELEIKMQIEITVEIAIETKQK